MGTLVQNNRDYEATSDGSFAVAYSSNVTAGNLLVVSIGAYSETATVNTPTDTIGTTYLQAGTLLRVTSSFSPDAFLAVYYGIAPSSGANTVTVTFSANVTDKELKIWEISGVDTSNPLNQTNGATAANAGPSASGDITTTVPGFIIKFHQDYVWPASHNHAVGTPTTGWTEYGDTATGSDSAYRNETETGTFNGGFSWTGGDTSGWACRIVAFADAPPPPDKLPTYIHPGGNRPAPFKPGIAR